MNFTVLLFYKYTDIKEPEIMQKEILQNARNLNLLGRILVSKEGINGTVEGLTSNANEFSDWLLTFPELQNMNIKTSAGNGQSFPKLSVKIREEIVGTKFPKHINPNSQTGKYLKPDELKNWYKNNEDFVIIDMRNDYEFQSGHFKNSINPEIHNSRELPEKIEKLKVYQNKKVVTVCTGGIRCEKMSAYLIDQGFNNVYQLENGIHSYMEKYPGEDYLGTLYTFDNRLVMDFGGNREIIGKCQHCQKPTEKYINCQNLKCNLHYLVCDECLGNSEKIPCPKCK